MTEFRVVDLIDSELTTETIVQAASPELAAKKPWVSIWCEVRANRWFGHASISATPALRRRWCAFMYALKTVTARRPK